MHDEIFHCNALVLVLVGVDARSTYCYLLAPEAHRDAETWAIHLLYLQASGFNPEYLIVDQGTGLRTGQITVWTDKPCQGCIADRTWLYGRSHFGTQTGFKSLQDAGRHGTPIRTHTRTGENPVPHPNPWMPACAGMTKIAGCQRRTHNCAQRGRVFQ